MMFFSTILTYLQFNNKFPLLNIMNSKILHSKCFQLKKLCYLFSLILHVFNKYLTIRYINYIKLYLKIVLVKNLKLINIKYLR